MEGDIVERLRRESNGVTVNLNPWPTMREAADENGTVTSNQHYYLAR